MSSKILILSHPKLTQIVQQVIESMERLPEVTIRDVGFGGVIHFLNNHLNSISPNIIITGGAHWDMLTYSNFHTNVPIIPIPVTRFDLLQAALQAKQYGKRIAIIHYGEEWKELQDVLQDFEFEFQFFSYSSTGEATSIIQSLRKTGIDVIIGTSTICVLAEQFNIPSVFLHSKDSIIKILEHVARLETARLEIAATAQKWSLEFMKHPIFTYDLETTIEKYNDHSLPSIIEAKEYEPDIISKNTMIVEEFLFGKKLSSIFTKENSITHDNASSYFSIGSIICKDGKTNLTPLLKRIELETKGRVIYSFQGEECRFLFLTKTELTSEYVNNKIMSTLKISPGQIYGGICSSVGTKGATSSLDCIVEKVQEVQIARELSRMGSISDPICILDPSNPFSMLYKISQHSDLPEIKLLTPLTQHRNAEKLLYTLRLILDYGLSITAVANHIGTSRQTVYSSMEKIENLVGLLINPEKRLALSMELRILDLNRAINNVKMKTRLLPEVRNQQL